MIFLDPQLFKDITKEVETKINNHKHVTKLSFKEKVFNELKKANLSYLLETPKNDQNHSPKQKLQKVLENELEKKKTPIKKELIKVSKSIQEKDSKTNVLAEVDLNKRERRNASKMATNLIAAQSKLKNQKLRRPDNADDLISDLKIKLEKDDNTEVIKENFIMPAPAKPTVKRTRLLSKILKIEKNELKENNDEIKKEPRLTIDQLKQIKKSASESSHSNNYSTNDLILLEENIIKIDLLDDSEGDSLVKKKQSEQKISIVEKENACNSETKQMMNCYVPLTKFDIGVFQSKALSNDEPNITFLVDKNKNGKFELDKIKNDNNVLKTPEAKEKNVPKVLNETYNIQPIKNGKLLTPLASSSMVKKIMTKDSGSDSDNSPLAKLKKPNTIKKSYSVKKRIEEFENLKQKKSNGKNAKCALFVSNSPKKNIPNVQIQTFPETCVNNDLLSPNTVPKLKKQLAEKPTGTTPLKSVYETRAVTKAISVQKKEALMQIKIEEQRRKREEKQLKAKQAREALKRERQEELERQNQEKEQKAKQKLATRNKMVKEELLRKKEINAQRAFEIDERRKAEEAQRLAKIKEQVLLEQQRQAEYEEAELLRKKRFQEQHQAEEHFKLTNLNKIKNQLKSPQLPKFSQKSPVNTKVTLQSKFIDQVFSFDDDETLSIELPNEGLQLLEKQLRVVAQTKIPMNLATSFFQTTPEILEVSSIFPKSSHCTRDSSIMWNTPPRFSMIPKYES